MYLCTEVGDSTPAGWGGVCRQTHKNRDFMSYNGARHRVQNTALSSCIYWTLSCGLQRHVWVYKLIIWPELDRREWTTGVKRSHSCKNEPRKMLRTVVTLVTRAQREVRERVPVETVLWTMNFKEWSQHWNHLTLYCINKLLLCFNMKQPCEPNDLLGSFQATYADEIWSVWLWSF